jgi:hypothetical protein
LDAEDTFRLDSPAALHQTLLNAVRQGTRPVIVLYGSGINFWQYYPYLHQLPLKLLAHCSSIYGISGGAACIWYRVLAEIGHLAPERIKNYDEALRLLNHGSTCARFGRFFRNAYVYDAQELAENTATFTTAAARNMPLAEFPLRNFCAVSYDPLNDRVVFVRAADHPTIRMGDLIASVTLPRFWGKRRLCLGIPFDGMSLSDLDFAPRPLRRAATAAIKNAHPGEPVFILNLFKGTRQGEIRYVNCSLFRFPRLRQIWDFLLFWANCQNPRNSAMLPLSGSVAKGENGS